MAGAGAWKRKQKNRVYEIILAYMMISFGLLLIWLCLFEPAFMPEIQPKVYTEDLTLQEFIESSYTNLNTATRAELIELPGIGEVLADRIIAYREKHSGFSSIEELTQVEGIGEKKLEALLDYIYVE